MPQIAPVNILPDLKDGEDIKKEIINLQSSIK